MFIFGTLLYIFVIVIHVLVKVSKLLCSWKGPLASTTVKQPQSKMKFDDFDFFLFHHLLSYA